MKVLFFGDVVGKIGRRALIRILPKLKRKFKPDLILANVENLAHGLGVTRKTLQEIKNAGVDFFTSGNHIWSKKEIFEIFKDKDLKDKIIRPANYPPETPGSGEKIIKIGQNFILVINLLGRVFLEIEADCPFRKADEILARFSNKNLNAIIVDFHAEATSEKVALGHYLDGRASAVLGTHTHIGTIDAQILSSGTAFLSDIGMVGAKNSVIGVEKKNVLTAFLSQIPQNFEIPEKGEAIINAVFLAIDPKTKKASSIQRVDQEIKID
ncbi:MAG: TIGR00282 family metallophosphoesterase [Patescibacteria group bacterium]|nr:TIGR00282 family metallophosphoesterase [Patescibacteria group bacterium]